MKTNSYLLLLCGLTLLISCQKQTHSLTDEQRSQIADSARQVAQQVVALSNRLDFNAALDLYSIDPDARFTENGTTYPSLDAMRAFYSQFGPTLESLDIKPDKWDVVVLSKDVVTITLAAHFTIKAKGLSAYNGQYVWSAIIRKEAGQWVIFQVHESWLDFAQAIAALTPPKADEEK